MTAQELSFYLKLPLSTVYSLTKKGIIHGVKFGKHWRYLEREIKEYLLRTAHFSTYTPQPSIPDEKRKHPRINCNLRARLIPVLDYGGDSEQIGAIRNLSAGGALFSTNTPSDFLIGDPIKLVFDMPGPTARPLEVNGRIVRLAGGQNTCGIKFKALLPQDAEEINQYVG